MKAQEAKVEITPAVRKLAEERLKVLTTDITNVEAQQVALEDELRGFRSELDQMKAEQEEIATFLKAR